MRNSVFVDTSGFYALLVKDDDKHKQADGFLRQAEKLLLPFVTTDYVLSETATLLKARGKGHLLPAFFETVTASRACRVEWVSPERFARARVLCLRHLDSPWSFADCVSFCTMKELQITTALTKDEHFREAGFRALLA